MARRAARFYRFRQGCQAAFKRVTFGLPCPKGVHYLGDVAIGRLHNSRQPFDFRAHLVTLRLDRGAAVVRTAAAGEVDYVVDELRVEHLAFQQPEHGIVHDLDAEREGIGATGCAGVPPCRASVVTIFAVAQHIKPTAASRAEKHPAREQISRAVTGLGAELLPGLIPEPSVDSFGYGVGNDLPVGIECCDVLALGVHDEDRVAFFVVLLEPIPASDAAVKRLEQDRSDIRRAPVAASAERSYDTVMTLYLPRPRRRRVLAIERDGDLF